MEGIRKNNNLKESGIALVLSIIIIASSLFLITGVYWMMTGAWKSAVINKLFGTAQETAGGGVEYAKYIIETICKEKDTSGLGISNFNTMKNAVYFCNVSDTGEVKAKTADDRFTITIKIQCLYKEPIAGTGGGITFGSQLSNIPIFYFYYRIVSEVKDCCGSIGQTEAVFRYAR